MEIQDYYRGFFIASFSFLISGGRKKIRLNEKSMVSHWFKEIWGIVPSYSQEFFNPCNPIEIYCYVSVSAEERERYLNSDVL